MDSDQAGHLSAKDEHRTVHVQPPQHTAAHTASGADLAAPAHHVDDVTGEAIAAPAADVAETDMQAVVHPGDNGGDGSTAHGAAHADAQQADAQQQHVNTAQVQAAMPFVHEIAQEPQYGGDGAQVVPPVPALPMLNLQNVVYVPAYFGNNLQEDPASEGQVDEEDHDANMAPQVGGGEAMSVHQMQEGGADNPYSYVNLLQYDEQPANEPQVEKLICVSCFDGHVISHIFIAPICGHVLCRPCLQRHLLNSTLEYETFPLQCVMCPLALDPVFCLDVFADDTALQDMIATYIAKRHQQYRYQSVIDNMELTEDMVRMPDEGPSTHNVSECAACCDHFAKSIDPMTCGHSFCPTCMHTHLNILVREKNQYPPSCPICRKELDQDLCRRFLQSTPQLREAFDNYVIVKQHINNLYFCANPFCATPFDFIPNDSQECSEKTNKVTCPMCLMHTCTRCKEMCQLDASCRSCLDMDLLVLASQRGWRNCPFCGMMIDKIGGCDTIFCFCGRTFRYSKVDPRGLTDQGMTVLLGE